jgi:transposase
MHLAWRWFTGLSSDQDVPHHSTFSKNRHGRFQELNLFRELFEEVVNRCIEVGLVKGDHLLMAAASSKPMLVNRAAFLESI